MMLIFINSFIKQAPVYRNQSIDMQSKSMDCFLYERDLRHERFKQHLSNIWISIQEKVKQHWDWLEKMRCL